MIEEKGVSPAVAGLAVHHALGGVAGAVNGGVAGAGTGAIAAGPGERWKGAKAGAKSGAKVGGVAGAVAPGLNRGMGLGTSLLGGGAGVMRVQREKQKAEMAKKATEG